MEYHFIPFLLLSDNFSRQVIFPPEIKKEIEYKFNKYKVCKK